MNIRHSRDDVVRAALEILDQYGLPDLTMRRLAAALEVQPSALYWHVPNKQTLLALVADQIVSRAHPSDTAEPDDRMTAPRHAAHELRDALLAYRDGAEVVSSTLALGLGAGEARLRLTDAILSCGFDAETSEVAAETLLHFVLGYVFHEQQRIQADSLGVVADAVTADPLSAAHSDPNSSFEFGVSLFLAGLGAIDQVKR